MIANNVGLMKENPIPWIKKAIKNKMKLFIITAIKAKNNPIIKIIHPSTTTVFLLIISEEVPANNWNIAKGRI